MLLNDLRFNSPINKNTNDFGYGLENATPKSNKADNFFFLSEID